MAVYVKINDNQYAASITGRLHDKDWDNRESKAITLEMLYEDVVKNFTNDVQWYILQEIERAVEVEDTETGEVTMKTVTNLESYDNSEYSIVGDITMHQNGTVTVKMGKPTAEELFAMFEEVLGL